MGLEQLRPGDIGIGPIHGVTGFGVGMGQLALATIEPGLIWRQGPRKWWEKRHAGIVTPGNRFVQAMPGGAEEIELRPETHWTAEWTFIRPEYITAEMMGVGDMDSHGGANQGRTVAEAARSYIGTPYDFATYGAIPLYRVGMRTRSIKRIISDTGTMMCSRLVDAALADAGYHLFEDGRLPGNVTPSELYRQLRRLPHSVLFDYRSL